MQYLVGENDYARSVNVPHDERQQWVRTSGSHSEITQGKHVGCAACRGFGPVRGDARRRVVAQLDTAVARIHHEVRWSPARTPTVCGRMKLCLRVP